VYQGLVQP